MITFAFKKVLSMISYILSPSYFQKLFTKLKIQKNGLTNIFSFLLSTTLLPNSNLKKKKKELSLIPNHFHFHFKHLSLLSNSTTRIIHFSIIPLISTHFQKPSTTIKFSLHPFPSPPLHLETNKQTNKDPKIHKDESLPPLPSKQIKKTEQRRKERGRKSNGYPILLCFRKCFRFPASSFSAFFIPLPPPPPPERRFHR